MVKGIGFIGLGTMGRPMATNLSRGLQPLFLHSRSGVPESLRALGMACSSPKEVAHLADIVIMMLPSTPDVEAVLFGREGVAEGLTPGKIVVDMSSIAAGATKAFSKQIAGLQCEYLDAPVSGGEIGAQNATLTVMVGGAESTFRQVRPIFELMGKNITLVGENGAGQTCKMANQIIVALTIEAVAEALLFASKSGVDPSSVRRALMGGFASSRVLEVHGERMINRNFEPGFRVQLHQKDLDLALNEAKNLNLCIPNTSTTQQLFSACTGNGGAGLDHSALVKALEILSNFDLGSWRVRSYV